MQDFTRKTVREIAVAMPVTTRIFEEFKIDYCCGGGRSFYDACQFAGVSPEMVSKKINQILKKETSDSDLPKEQTTSELIDYIVETHHVFTKNEILRLLTLMEKVCRKHGAQHPELFALQMAFTNLCNDLIPHLKKEENVLFPFIKHLEMSEKHNLSSPHPPFGTVKNPVRMMMIEHDHDGEILREMREISHDYVLPENACPSFQALYFGLEEFEKDLHQHIHLENNVLFPNAVRLEQKVIFGY